MSTEARTQDNIIKEMQEVARLRERHAQTYNEGGEGYNPHDYRLDELDRELNAAQKTAATMEEDGE